jgi:hypothetical protein
MSLSVLVLAHPMLVRTVEMEEMSWCMEGVLWEEMTLGTMEAPFTYRGALPILASADTLNTALDGVLKPHLDQLKWSLRTQETRVFLGQWYFLRGPQP